MSFAAASSSALAMLLLPAPFSLVHGFMLAGALLPIFAMARRPSQNEPMDDRLEQINDARWELADNESRYRQLLDTQDDLIVRRRSTGGLVFVNRAYCLAFGVSSPSVLGSRFMPVVIAEDLRPADGGPAQGPQQLVQCLETTSGPRWISWDEQRVATGDLDYEIQSSGRDVTEQRRADAELREARDQAEAANRAKSRFLAAMSHEIRTPMNGILGMASLMRETELSDEQETYIRAVDQSAQSLLALIDEILDFSKIEAGKVNLVSRPFSLRRCLSSALEILAPRASDKGLSLTWTIAPGVPEVVEGDEARVRQIVLNLVSNAVKFTESGSIDVAVFSRGGGDASFDGAMIAIEVRDTGIGLSADTMKRLFDEFEQAEPRAGRRDGGTGLGLAISRRLARAMGGDITAASAPGEGSTFTAAFWLAAGRGSEQDFPDTVAATNIGRLLPEIEPLFAARLRVLIAEDNEINALLARRVIEKVGGYAEVVGDGRAAIAAITKSREPGERAFDLILMDVLMPEVDGLEATRAIKALWRGSDASRTSPAIPIVALTANAFAEDRDRCLAAGMDDFLAKPFDACHLRDLVVRWVPHRRPAAAQLAHKPAAAGR